MGTAHGTLVPYGGFRTKTDDIVLAVANDGLWKKLCQALDWQDLLADERFLYNKDRVALRVELEKIMNDRFSTMTADAIIEALTDVGVPCGPIQTIEQVLQSPQVIAREMMVPIAHPNVPDLQVPAFPVKFSATPAKVHSPPPLLGEHTNEVLQQLGYTDEEIAHLKIEEII